MPELSLKAVINHIPKMMKELTSENTLIHAVRVNSLYYIQFNNQII